MNFDDRLNRLNKNQRSAVLNIDGPMLVIAGPGSGKTEILSLRVCQILKNTDTKPSSILCLTFTDAGAFNMRQRLISLIGKDAYKVSIYTFHSFCTDIISSYPEYFFNSVRFNPADEALKREVLNKIFLDMDFKNPLRSFHNDKFVFLEDVLSSISDVKKAGINPLEFKNIIDNNKEELEKISPILKKIPARVSKKDISVFKNISEEINNIFGYLKKDSLAEAVVFSLNRVCEDAESMDSSKPLSEWKEKFVLKSDDGFVLKDFSNLEKLYSFVSVYEKYETEIKKRGFFDFDDMIMEVVKKIQQDEVFLSILSEKFQYILVDEFQDTNDAQMKLLFSLTSSFIHEEKPNIMAVGDDDQAIFRFQGAEVLNMVNFINKYKDVKIVSLNENYRSTQDILNISESLIKQSDFSLRKILPQIQKKIFSVSGSVNGGVHFKMLPDILSEYYFIAEEIKYLNKTGIDFKDIAVISRKHEFLKGLIPYLHHFGIAVNYQKKKNILEDEIVFQIIEILRFVDTALKGLAVRDDILSKILSFPFWQISQTDIWTISLNADKQKITWLEAMKSSSNKKIEDIADFLIDLSVKARFLPAERIIDLIVGSNENLDQGDLRLKSSFKDFYFSKEILREDKTKYLSFLSSLKVFIETVREYKNTENPTVSDIVSFLDIYISNGLEILDESFYNEDENSVNLLTAHKSKGLEFKVVFVISSDRDTWIKTVYNNKIVFPMNLKLRPSPDSLDDKIRLFYVSITRAKEVLYIVSHRFDTKGRDMSLPDFLGEHMESFKDHSFSEKTLPLEIDNKKDILISENDKSLLSPILKDYKMSVTHLNNFLNVINSGPSVFLEQNLLRFPQAKTLSSVYGTAIHESLSFASIFLKREGKLPDIEFILNKGFEEIKKGRLKEEDVVFLKSKIKETLSSYFDEMKDDFKEGDFIETNFNNEGVVISGASITGKIDKMFVDSDQMVVVDFKTGKAFDSFEENDSQGKILSYKRQLLFYKLLVENSSTFSKYKVNTGVLQFMDMESGFQKLILYIKDEDVSRLSDLIVKVYRKIQNLDFPDTSKYPQTVSGIKQFEDDLLSDSI